MIDLTSSDKNALLSLARFTLQTYVKTRTMPDTRLDSPAACQPMGVSVTLQAFGQFRGGAGFLEGEQPLWKKVMDATAAAAAEYPGVLPIGAEELPHVRITMTLFSDLQLVRSSEEIELGRTGLAIRGDPPAALLPETAAQKNWTPEDFLQAICKHAGLPADSWRTGTPIMRFTTETFGEEDVN